MRLITALFSSFIGSLFFMEGVRCDIDPVPKIVRSILNYAKYNKNDLPYTDKVNSKCL